MNTTRLFKVLSLVLCLVMMLSALAACDLGKKEEETTTKAPEETTLREVIEAIDGPYYISRCAGSTEYTCSHPNESCCRYQKTFFDISQLVKNELEKQTFKR